SWQTGYHPLSDPQPKAVSLSVLVTPAPTNSRLRRGRQECACARRRACPTGLFVEGGVEEGAEAMAAAGVAQLAEGLCFDLADALASDGEVLSDFFERVLAAVLQAEAHLDDLLLARAERLQDLSGLFAKVQVDH